MQSVSALGDIPIAGCLNDGHEKVPTVQSAKSDEPATNVVRPMGHGRQSSADAAPDWGLYVPRGHARQEEERAVGEYVPGRHISHSPAPAVLKLPAAHGVHSANVLAPSAELAVPGGQARQDELPWPGAGLYRPAGQGVQLEADVAATASRKLPAVHAVHDGEP
jgi:hypothetical protein